MPGPGSNIRQTLCASSEELFARPNVVATGIGYKVKGGQRTGELSIVCSVEQKVEAERLTAQELLPKSVGGIPTDVIQTGILRAWHEPTGRHRPAPGGVSIGHRDITAGTLGCLVRRGDQVFILSNNHVLAASNEGVEGDPILQPGPSDGGELPADRIATLVRYVPLSYSQEPGGCGSAATAGGVVKAIRRALGGQRAQAASTPGTNLVDCALALPDSLELVSDRIIEISSGVTGLVSAELGMSVRKSGRTSGYTEGAIEQVDVTADVWYGDRRARFRDQVMAGAMSKGGDSGSAVLDPAGKLVGLLFGGGESTTLINRIEHVLDALDVEPVLTDGSA